MLQSETQGTNIFSRILDFVQSEQFTVEFKAIIQSQREDTPHKFDYQQLQTLRHQTKLNPQKKSILQDFKLHYKTFYIGIALDDETNEYHLQVQSEQNDFNIQINKRNLKLQYAMLTDVDDWESLIDKQQINLMRNKLLNNLSDITRIVAKTGQVSSSMYASGFCAYTDLPLDQIALIVCPDNTVSVSIEEARYILQQFSKEIESGNPNIYDQVELIHSICHQLTTTFSGLAEQAFNVLTTLAEHIDVFLKRKLKDKGYNSLLQLTLDLGELIIKNEDQTDMQCLTIDLRQGFYNAAMHIMTSVINQQRYVERTDINLYELIKMLSEAATAFSASTVTIIPDYDDDIFSDVSHRWIIDVETNLKQTADLVKDAHSQYNGKIYVNKFTPNEDYYEYLAETLKCNQIQLFATEQWLAAAQKQYTLGKIQSAVTNSSADINCLKKLKYLIDTIPTVNNNTFKRLPQQILSFNVPQV